MRLYHQFDLNLREIEEMGREFLSIPPYLIEELTKKLTKRGYTVLKSSADFMGLPQSITVIKEFTGPFAILFSKKIKEDFDAVSGKLGIKKLFE